MEVWMKHRVTNRTATLMIAAIVVVIGACSDANGSGPNLIGPNPSASSGSGGPGDTSKTGGNTGDTSISHNPPPSPVPHYTLNVNVGTTRPSATDTLTTDPVVGAVVSVVQQTSTFTGHPGADSVNITTTVIATATSDASGNVSFPGLVGSTSYVLKAAPPAGSNLAPVSLFVGQAFSDVVKLSVTLHRP
jgi:hypothetical protein